MVGFTLGLVIGAVIGYAMCAFYDFVFEEIDNILKELVGIIPHSIIIKI